MKGNELTHVFPDYNDKWKDNSVQAVTYMIKQMNNHSSKSPQAFVEQLTDYDLSLMVRNVEGIELMTSFIQEYINNIVGGM